MSESAPVHPSANPSSPGRGLTILVGLACLTWIIHFSLATWNVLVESARQRGWRTIQAEHLRTGRQALEQGDPVRARVAFDAALQSQTPPPGPELADDLDWLRLLQACLAEAELRSPELEQVEYIINRQRARNAIPPHLLRIAQGRAAVARGKLEEARDAFRKAVELEPSAALAQLQLGLTLRSLKQEVAAIHALRAALTTQPGLGRARVELAATLLRQKDPGKHEEARQLLETHLREAPGDLIAEYYLGLLESRQGRFDRSFEHFQRAAPLKQTLPFYDKELGLTLVQLGRLDDAGRLLDAAYQRTLDAEYLFALAMVLYRQQQADRMLQVLSVAQQARPDYFDLHYQKGLAYELKGEQQQAIQSFREYIARSMQGDGEGPNPTQQDAERRLNRLEAQSTDAAGLRQPPSP